MIRKHEIDFRVFVRRWDLPSARKYFEHFVTDFLKCRYSYQGSIKNIRLNPGDWGIDVIEGSLLDRNIIWQCKFFLDDIEKSQKDQVTDAYNAVISKSKKEKFKVYRWILCLPKNLSTKELVWWERWKKKREEREDVIIECLLLGDFLSKCHEKEYNSLFQYYFKEGETLEPLPKFVKKVEEDQIYIKNIQNSDISTDINKIKQWYYYGEYFENNILKRNSDIEIQQLNSVYIDLETIWDTLHSKIYNLREDDDGNDLFISIREKLYDRIDYYQKRFSFLDYPTLIGLILKLSDINTIYWSRNKRDY